MKERCPFELHVIKYCGLSENIAENQPIAMDFGTLVDLACSVDQAANAKFQADVVPVLEKCNANLKVSKIIIEAVSEEFPRMAKNLNFKDVLSEIESALTNINKLIK